ncbi:MAG: imidazolonepropionase, partial [Anaerolineae bacterium]|nr:imidazolonepropionase [Anaerolineae bacterium]
MLNLRGNLVYTGNDVIENGIVTLDGSLLAGVAKAARGDVAGSYPVITPALIDAHSHIGLTRGGEPSDEAEANEHMEALLAHADVLDSVQMDDVGFADSIESGVLYSCVLPGSGNIIGGNSAVIRNYGSDTNAAFVRRSGIKAAFGYNPMHVREWKGQRPYTRMGALAMLRAKLHDVKTKMDKEAAKDDADVTYTAEETVMKALLSGEERLRIHVHKADDIAAILRFVDEWGLKVMVEHT